MANAATINAATNSVTRARISSRLQVISHIPIMGKEGVLVVTPESECVRDRWRTFGAMVRLLLLTGREHLPGRRGQPERIVEFPTGERPRHPR